jgi:hypothetical protein
MSGYALAVGHGMTTAGLPRWRWGRVVVLAMVALLALAGQQLVAQLVTADPSPASTPPADSAETWPAGLREAAEAARYHFASGTDGAWAATTPAQGLRTAFGPAGPAVSPLADGWELTMALARIGRPGAMVDVETAEVTGSASGVEYRRGPALTEWYRNEARGLEQGFTLATAPAGEAGPLLLELDTSGLAIALSPDGTEVVGATADAGTVLRYSGLEVTDATGRRIPASLGVEGQTVQLRVDDAGAPYPLIVDPWFRQAKLVAPDRATDDKFGWSVAVSGDTAVVGAPDDDILANVNAGSAYVFLRSGVTWALQQKLTAPGGLASDFFGISVAVSGDTALVGAYQHDIAANGDAGSAYVFLRSGVTWAQQQKLTAADGATNDRFGVSVAVSGDTAVVGAYHDDTPAADAGSAYVFLRSGVTWAQQPKLTASDGAAGDRFGTSVAVSGDTAVVGAVGDNTPAGADAGSAYVFLRSGVTWAQQQKLTASDGAASAFFGSSVAVSGDTVVVGAYSDDTPAGVDAGSAYVFLRSGVTWALPQKLIAPDGAATELFGSSVAVSGDTVVVGAYNDDIGAIPGAGSASVFDVDNAVPTCSYTMAAGPPKRLDFTVQDTGSGIASIATLSLLNIVTPVPIPAFTVGTTAPVLFSATKDVQNQRSTIAIVITDMAGNQSSCV